jgi:hypothetical protein
VRKFLNWAKYGHPTMNEMDNMESSGSISGRGGRISTVLSTCLSRQLPLPLVAIASFPSSIKALLIVCHPFHVIAPDRCHQSTKGVCWIDYATSVTDSALLTNRSRCRSRDGAGSTCGCIPGSKGVGRLRLPVAGPAHIGARCTANPAASITSGGEGDKVDLTWGRVGRAVL